VILPGFIDVLLGYYRGGLLLPGCRFVQTADCHKQGRWVYPAVPVYAVWHCRGGTGKQQGGISAIRLAMSGAVSSAAIACGWNDGHAQVVASIPAPRAVR